MGNISLYALTQGGTGFASYVQLDLYADEPIKLTKSIQELESPQATTSNFTKTFRIPSTSTNGQFMRAVFNVNSVDFNATQKAKAYINVNDAYFTSGNIRLVSVHEIASKTKIEYEIIFMGETSTFASEVGVKTLASLSGLGLVHEKNYTNIVKSWSGTLKEGNILYPLCEWGYTYDSATDLPNESTLSVYNPSGTNLSQRGFTNSTYALSQDQFKPFIRTKWIWDSIFTEAGFTYTSNFLTSDFFKSLYSILSSVDTSGVTYTATNTFRVGFSANQKYSTGASYSSFSLQAPIIATSVFTDTTNNYSTTGNGFFTSPEDGFYTFSVDRMFVSYGIRPFPYKPGSPGNIYAQNFVVSLRWKDEFGVNQEQDVQAWVNTDPGNINRNTVYNAQDFTTPILFWSSIYLQKGAKISIWIEVPASQFTTLEVIKGVWNGNTTTQSIPQGMLPEQYKQLEFIKGINDRFKLMWEPDAQNPNNFYIEPWVDWVRGGVNRDWTDKLNTNFEIKTQPLFYTQARQYNFKDSSDTDLYNFSYEQKNKQTFGQLNQDSGIELITGTKEITSIFSPFPLGPIPGSDSFLIPHFAKDTETQRQPIQIKPRLCFYNGTGPAPVTWYLKNDAGAPTAWNYYPIVSSFSRYPFDSNSTDLSWTNVAQFWDEQAVGFSGRTVSSAYNNYWKSWFDSTFDPYSRQMTATFALDSTDITELRFNDKIFVRDSWWLPVKITDYQIGTKQNVKVDLVKLGAVGVSFFNIETPENQLFKQEGICYGTTFCEACCCTGLFSLTLYTPTADFITTNYFQDPTGTTPAAAGWYSNGLVSIFINEDGIGVAINTCDECSCTPTGLVSFPDVCAGSSLCQACCCTGVVYEAVYGNGGTLGSSTSVYTGPAGGAFTPGTWLSSGFGDAVQVGPDGTTIIQVSSCVQCVCNERDPIGRVAQYYFPDDIQQACCIQGATGFQGIFNYWGTTGNFAAATGIYLDVAGSLPAGSTAAGFTGPVYLSEGEYVKTVVNGSVLITSPCAFAAPCPGRTQLVDFNSINITTGSDVTIDYTYTISYDGLTYYWAGDSQSTGAFFTDTTSIFYDSASLIQVTVTAAGISPIGVLNWEILVGGETGASGSFFTPATFTLPTQLCGTGGVEYNFNYTL